MATEPLRNDPEDPIWMDNFGRDSCVDLTHIFPHSSRPSSFIEFDNQNKNEEKEENNEIHSSVKESGENNRSVLNSLENVSFSNTSRRTNKSVNSESMKTYEREASKLRDKESRKEDSITNMDFDTTTESVGNNSNASLLNRSKEKSKSENINVSHNVNTSHSINTYKNISSRNSSRIEASNSRDNYDTKSEVYEHSVENNVCNYNSNNSTNSNHTNNSNNNTTTVNTINTTISTTHNGNNTTNNTTTIIKNNSRSNINNIYSSSPSSYSSTSSSSPQYSFKERVFVHNNHNENNKSSVKDEKVSQKSMSIHNTQSSLITNNNNSYSKTKSYVEREESNKDIKKTSYHSSMLKKVSIEKSLTDSDDQETLTNKTFTTEYTSKEEHKSYNIDDFFRRCIDTYRNCNNVIEKSNSKKKVFIQPIKSPYTIADILEISKCVL